MAKQLPKYKEIERDLLSQIQNGQLKAGDRVMTENELCERYQVSRMTARKALESLAVQGIVCRTAGRGTFVNSIHVRKPDAKITSFSADIRSVGMTPGSILAEYRIRPASELPRIARELNVADSEPVHCICRIRTANDMKVALNYTYIPCSILPKLELRMLEGSIYEYIEQQYEMYPYAGPKTISAVLPTQEQKRLLEIDETALLQIAHPGYLMDGRAFEYTITYYVGSRIIYTNNSGQVESAYQMQPTSRIPENILCPPEG